MKLYISGPMRGRKFFNFPAFETAANQLRDLDHVPFNPAEMERKSGFDPERDLPQDWDWNKIPDDHDMVQTFHRDVAAIIAADGIVMLTGWGFSVGATAEYWIAKWLGKERFVLVEGELLSIEDTGLRLREVSAEAADEDVLEEALRITSGDRNAQYGPPDQDFERTAGMWSAFLGHDISKSDVASMMIMLKCSRNTHQKKRDNWVDIAGYARCGAICDGVD
ncbi:DUF6378 domain-containing protein [Porticoccus sp.]